MDTRSIVSAFFGALLLVYPNIVVRRVADRRHRRLEVLRHGGEETYFEERRTLEAYPVVQKLWFWRMIGLTCLLLGSGSLILQNWDG